MFRSSYFFVPQLQPPETCDFASITASALVVRYAGYAEGCLLITDGTPDKPLDKHTGRAKLAERTRMLEASGESYRLRAARKRIKAQEKV